MATKLLLDEPPLVLQPGLACAVGLNEALFVQQLHYWMRFNLKAGRGTYQGRVWVYNTLTQWHEQFPFWSRNTLRRTIDKCVKMGIVDKALLSHDPRDRTLSYSLNYERLEHHLENWGNDDVISEDAQMNALHAAHLSKATHGHAQSGHTHMPKVDTCISPEWAAEAGINPVPNGYSDAARLHTETTTETISQKPKKKLKRATVASGNSLAEALADDGAPL